MLRESSCHAWFCKTPKGHVKKYSKGANRGLIGPKRTPDKSTKNQQKLPPKPPPNPLRTHSMLCNSASGPVNRPSGPDCGRTAIGKAPKSAGGPISVLSPAKIRPGRPIHGPEPLLRNIEYGTRGMQERPVPEGLGRARWDELKSSRRSEACVPNQPAINLPRRR